MVRSCWPFLSSPSSCPTGSGSGGLGLRIVLAHLCIAAPSRRRGSPECSLSIAWRARIIVSSRGGAGGRAADALLGGFVGAPQFRRLGVPWAARIAVGIPPWFGAQSPPPSAASAPDDTSGQGICFPPWLEPPTGISTPGGSTSSRVMGNASTSTGSVLVQRFPGAQFIVSWHSRPPCGPVGRSSVCQCDS